MLVEKRLEVVKLFFISKPKDLGMLKSFPIIELGLL